MKERRLTSEVTKLKMAAIKQEKMSENYEG